MDDQNRDSTSPHLPMPHPRTPPGQGEKIKPKENKSAGRPPGGGFKNALSRQLTTRGSLKDRTKGAIKQGAKELAMKGIEYGGNAIAPGLGTAAVIAIKHRKQILITILSIICFILLLFFMLFSAGSGVSGTNPQTNPLTITKTGPEAIANSTNFSYTITVSYPYTAQDIIITDKLDPSTKFVDSQWKKYSIDAASNTITWKASDNTPNYKGTLSAPITISFTFTVQPTAQNTYVYNLGATAEVLGSAGGGNIAYTPPNTNTCNGTYQKDFDLFAQYGFTQKNYGDPNCELASLQSAQAQDKIYQLVLQTEESMNKNNPDLAKKFAAIWYTIIIPGESGYDPDDWAPPTGVQQQLDSGGAWGLFQMGSSTPAGKTPVQNDPSTWGKNGFYDRGDVNWENQINNAVSYNHNLGCTFWYWSTYRTGHTEVTQC